MTALTATFSFIHHVIRLLTPVLGGFGPWPYCRLALFPGGASMVLSQGLYNSSFQKSLVPVQAQMLSLIIMTLS